MAIRSVKFLLMAPAVAWALSGCGGDGDCGDGIINSAEECDDGNDDSGDGCSAACSFEFCGDGVVNNGEQCDDGNDDDGDGCTNGCFSEDCGNAIVDIGEECDDGNAEDGDGCSVACMSEVCGDGVINNGEECDDGDVLIGDGCSDICTFEFCGDGVVNNIDEECDDGNVLGGDGCRPDCQGIELCGDGLVDAGAGEACDDGNFISGDGCRADCLGLEQCGDGQFDPITGELCDDGNLAGGDGCRADCDGFEVCGDNLFDPDAGEVCEDGNNNPGDGCRADCLGLEVCGDGFLDSIVGEFCDDGNNVGFDGCRADCSGTVDTPTPVDIAAFGASIVVNGTIDGTEPQWNRPGQTCLADGGSDTHFYDVFSFVNNLGTDTLLTVTASWAGDGYLHIFGDPLLSFETGQCLAGDDDFNGTAQSQIVDVFIEAGAVHHLIASTFSAGAIIGAYTIDVHTQSPPVCGNGTVETSEECDDGNTVPDDGCDNNCMFVFNEVEPNNTAPTANPFNGTFIAQISPALDFDFVFVDALAGQTIIAETFDLDNTSCANFTIDSELRIFDTDGVTQRVLDDDGGGGFCSRAVFTAPVAGRYFVRAASSQQFAPNDTFAYRMTVTVN